ncbi:MAG: hypothetical protein PHR96_03290 [Clostridia bacterium]|nr:hypothetical protein [Clostridia bacterium]
MQNNIYDTVLKNVDGYYKKYLLQTINIKFGNNLIEGNIKVAQKKGIIFAPKEFEAYIKSLREETECNTSELPDVLYSLKTDLEKRQIQGSMPGKTQKLINERREISNKMGVVTFLQSAEQQNLNNCAKSR